MAPNIAAFAHIIRSPRLTMCLYNPETDLPFLLDLWNVSNGQLPAWRLENLLRLYRNVTLSPHNCLGLTPPCNVVYVVHLGDEHGERIGQINFSERHPDIAPDLGYSIVPSHQQQGYGMEAALTVKNYLISFGFKEMTGFCLPTNGPSNSMLRKLGFESGGQALANGNLVVNAYVLPGMKHFSVETTKFSRMGVDK